LGLQVLRRGVPLVGFVLLLALVAAAGGSGATGDSGVRVGQPWTGAGGITRTTGAIMQQPTTHHGLVAPPEHDANLQLRPNPNSPSRTTDQALGAAIAGPKLSVGTSFTGATLNEETSSTGGFVPPDSMGAVGPTQFLVAVNGKIKVLSKTGTVGSLNTSLDAFFSSVLSPGGVDVETTDPRVRYDKLSGRWFVTAIDVDAGVTDPTDNRFLIAVSDGSTITSSTVWTLFQFQQNLASATGDNDRFADFDTLGIDANALYMGANMFDDTGTYVSSSVFVIRKSSVTGAGGIVVTAFRDVVDPTSGDGPFTPQGVDNDDPAATEGYFVGHDDQFFGQLDVLRVGTPGGTPTLSASLPVAVAADSFAINVPASGGAKLLDGGDIRLADASIRNGKLYTSEAIAVSSSGAATNAGDRDASRWYELANLTTTPSLSRSGTIFDSSATAKSYWMPSIAVTPQGHAVIGMSTSAAALHPNAAFSSMLSGASSFDTPTTFTSASATYNVRPTDSVYRWGDYSHTSVDPCDGQTVWTIQEYVDAADSWGVEVGKILAPPPATPASTSPSSVGAGLSSTSVTLTGTSTSGSGFWDPGSGSCRIAASVSGGVTVNSVTYTDPTHVTLDLSTAAASGGSHTITITNPDGQTSSAAVLTVTTAPQNIALPTISGTTGIGDTLTAHDGTWSGLPAPTFSYQWKRCDSAGANCSAIAGATASTYVIASDDAGYRIRVAVTGTNASGSASADSATADVTGPVANLTAPTISGTAQVGSSLTAHSGSWTGVPAPVFSYQWQRCDSAGANCSAIASATAATYQPVAGDVGSTLVVEVSGNNGGGDVGPVPSAATPAVVAAPVSGGGGGGGGGGSSSPPDVVAAISASPSNPTVGSTVTYVVQASVLSGNAVDVVATINLPSQVTLVGASVNRGSGCTGTTTLTCDLNFLNGTLVATVQVVTQVTQAGSLVATASLATVPGDKNTANNSATSTLTVAAPPSPLPPSPSPPSVPAPSLNRIGTTPLVGARHLRTETVAVRFRANERLRLVVRVTPLRSTRRLTLLAQSALAGTTVRSSRTILQGTARRAGGYALRLVLSKNKLVRGRTYVIHLTAVSPNGKRTTLSLRFRA
jgi:hypothetical protein